MSLIRKQRELEGASDTYLQQLLQQGSPEYPGWLVAAVADQRTFERQLDANAMAMARAEEPTITDQVATKLGGAGVPSVDPNQMGDPRLATGIASGVAVAGGGMIPEYQNGGLMGDDDDPEIDLPELPEDIVRVARPYSIDEVTMPGAAIRPGGTYTAPSRVNLGRLTDFATQLYDRSLDRPSGRRDVSPLERQQGIQSIINQYAEDLDLTQAQRRTLREQRFESQQAAMDTMGIDAETLLAEASGFEIDPETGDRIDPSRQLPSADFPRGSSFREAVENEYRAALAEGDEEAAERAFNNLIRSQGLGSRAGGLDGTGTGPSGFDPYARGEQFLQDFEDLMRTKSDEDLVLERTQRDIAQKKYEQARGLASLDEGRLGEMEGMLDRRTGLGRGRIAELERLEDIRKAGEPLAFDSVFMGDIADALRGRITFSDVSAGAREFGDEMTEAEAEALQAIYDEETSLLETEDTALGRQYALRRQIQTDTNAADLINLNLDEDIAEADATRGRAGAAELLTARMGMLSDYIREAGLNNRAMMEVEAALESAMMKARSDMPVFDPANFEYVINLIQTARNTFADEPQKVAAFNAFERLFEEANATLMSEDLLTATSGLGGLGGR